MGLIQDLHGVGQDQLDLGDHGDDGQDVQSKAHRVAPGGRGERSWVIRRGLGAFGSGR